MIRYFVGEARRIISQYLLVKESHGIDEATDLVLESLDGRNAKLRTRTILEAELRAPELIGII